MFSRNIFLNGVYISGIYYNNLNTLYQKKPQIARVSHTRLPNAESSPASPGPEASPTPPSGREAENEAAAAPAHHTGMNHAAQNTPRWRAQTTYWLFTIFSLFFILFRCVHVYVSVLYNSPRIAKGLSEVGNFEQCAYNVYINHGASYIRYCSFAAPGHLQAGKSPCQS